MTALFEWPALQTERRFVPKTLDYERGVWGKVHGAPTDFRWIAQSDDFGRDRPELYSQLNLGDEDAPISFAAWRTLGDRCYAISGSRSRAIDASGRRGFLEKQILEWRRPANVPVALGALLLLPHVATMTDEIWWDRGAWSHLEVHQPILASDHAPLSVTEGILVDAFERGRDALRETVDLETLKSFFAQVLAGRGPALLGGMRQPLTPESLAALLLPLPREIADRISITGWIPTSRPVIDALARNWDAMVTSQSVVVSPVFASDPQAVRMAERLTQTGVSALQTARSTDAPVGAPPKPVNNGHPRPGLELQVTVPPDGTPAMLVALYRFAKSSNRRWLTPDDLRQAGSMPYINENEPAAQLLCDWFAQVRDQPPPLADPLHWSVKVDVMRSAALVLAPYRPTLLAVGQPASDSRVPALLFALLLDRNHDRLAGIGTPALRQLLEQSLTCRGSEKWSKRVREWIQTQWGPKSLRNDVRDAIGHALKAHPE